MKKWLTGILFVLATGVGYGIYHIETEYVGIGLPWTTEIDLPPLRQYENVQTTLKVNDTGVIYFPSKSPYDFSVLLTDFANAPESTGMGTLFIPKTASTDNPVPAMIILHGSGGLHEEREFGYAKLFNQHGIAALVLDYYTPRGADDGDTYLQKTFSASEVDIVVDAYSALKVLGTHPLIKADKIGVTGYSYGGMATRYTLDARIKDIVAPDVAPFAAHADFYGPCHQTLGSNVTTKQPYLAVFGDQDNSVNPALCNVVHQALADAGSVVETLMIEGAGHAWENNTPRAEYDFPYIKNCTFSFAPESGISLINGKPTAQAKPQATREQRAYARARIMLDAPECIGHGYIVGSDPATDKVAKAKLMNFLNSHLKETL